MGLKSLNRVDDLVQSVGLYNPKKLILSGYALPFLILEGVWIYCWLFVYGTEEYYQEGFAGIAAIGVIQIIICLCCQWSVHVYAFLNCSSAKDPYKASIVKVVPTPNNGSSELVQLFHQTTDKNPWFMFQKTKYCWDPDKKQFYALEYPINEILKHYNNWKGYLEEQDVANAENKYGKNRLEIVDPKVWELFKERAVAPFFVFQVFCVCLWCFDEYWYYSIFTLVMLIMFEYTLVIQQLRNMAEVRKMDNKTYMITAYRNRRWRPMSTDELLPGDIVSITRSINDNLVPCDILLLRGQCIVDESMLTGESVPQMKEPIEDLDGENELDINKNHKIHVLFGGTKVVQHTPVNKNTSGLRATDNGCVGYVLRTGFGTSQGKLLRTILFGVKRVTANNLESFGFILFLLIFAIAAASYVWLHGVADPNKSRYKLFLECCLILTSVIPPELPIELSLAVNSSLIALSKLGVYCTEPFRMPFAGKVDVCCFDKTGTLTSDNLVVEGITGINGSSEIIDVDRAPIESIQVLATCHSLAQLDDGIVGDPLEKATLKAVNWSLTKNDAVIPKKGKGRVFKIVQRYHFSSELKRMSVIAGFNLPNSTESCYIASVKGAPEVLKNMFSTLPDNYDETYLSYSRRGARVLALGYKKLQSSLTSQDLRSITRNDIESDLIFVGFITISCPLKADSSAIIKEIVNSSHLVIMITGDNPLTACHVGRELHFTKKSTTLILTKTIDDNWEWKSVDDKIKIPLGLDNVNSNNSKNIWKNYALCVTGDGLDYLKDYKKDLLMKLLPHIVIYARCEPKQKEFIVISLRNLGFTTLMCGDGTNDVGALKHADVGVALLSRPPKSQQPSAQPVLPPPNNGPLNRQQMNAIQLQKLMKEMEEDTQTIVKLGDASIAAPFTSKLSSIQCVCHIIKQGRCTLVTTLQMFKILALNALILAYSQSVLYLSGIKFSDMQATLQGILLALCFLFISKAKPLTVLSKQRPLPNIFNWYTILTVLLQFAVHFFCLVYLVREASYYAPPDDKLKNIINNSSFMSFNVINDTDLIDNNSDSTDIEKEEKYEPNIFNSAVYIICIVLQICSFTINYRGKPFMESLYDNKPFFYLLLGSFITVIGLSCGFTPLTEVLEIAEFPHGFRITLIFILIFNFIATFIIDRICRWLFGEGKLMKL